jgi:hypothetical protein
MESHGGCLSDRKQAIRRAGQILGSPGDLPHLQEWLGNCQGGVKFRTAILLYAVRSILVERKFAHFRRF